MAFGHVYLDNASTAHPKPDVVWQAARDFLHDTGASPGRGGYASARRASAMVEQARCAVALMLGVDDPSRVDGHVYFDISRPLDSAPSPAPP